MSARPRNSWVHTDSRQHVGYCCNHGAEPGEIPHHRPEENRDEEKDEEDGGVP